MSVTSQPPMVIENRVTSGAYLTPPAVNTFRMGLRPSVARPRNSAVECGNRDHGRPGVDDKVLIRRAV